MHSQHHRESLLNPDYNLAGFAVVHTGNTIYVTEDFGGLYPAIRVFQSNSEVPFSDGNKEGQNPKNHR